MPRLAAAMRCLAAACALAAPLLACAETPAGEGRQAAKPQSVAPARPAREAVREFDAEALGAIFDRQGALLRKALAGVAESRPGVPEFFFVGFAGEAGEDVFLNEARAAEDLFRRRFGAAGRTLVLANNLRTAKTLPMASVPTLGLALSGIARKMGPEDVLFLYVASHGRQGRISVRYGRANLPDLGGGELRRMLDEAGIGNRVLALSACYSGSLIAALRDAHTLIMTAAAHNRVSFGCGHDGPFTYFGRALIGEALERESSFPSAFRLARGAIEKREKAEGFRPSHPQIFVGGAILPALDAIGRRLSPAR
jgi:hypothetical protein